MPDNNALIEKFLTHKEINQGRSVGTVNSYQHKLSKLVEFLDGQGKTLLQASTDDLVEFAGLHLHQRGMAPRSRRPAIAAIRQFYQWLSKRRIIRENVAAGLEYPKIGRKLPYALTLQHAERLLMQVDMSSLKGCRDAAMIGVLLGTGVRVSGLVRLNQEDIVFDQDPDKGEIRFLRITEKGGHDRLVPLPLESYALIRCYLGHHSIDKIDRTLPDGKTVLFISEKNRTVSPADYFGESRRLTTSSVRRMILRYGSKAGIPAEYLHPHAMRHTYGTELAEAGVDIHVRQALMGHKAVESTLIYDRMSIRRLSDAVDKANPLARIKCPVTSIVNELRKKGIEGNF